jgi:hypothetical protein
VAGARPDDGLKHLSGASSLENLILQGTRVTREGKQKLPEEIQISL